ncbi:MAG: VanZ family protein [Anaerolineaceae bacterium]|nr:VanZ family protein [Anaerolineaceae bacterium]
MTIPFFPIAFSIGLALLAISLFLLHRAGHSWLHLMLFACFWLYSMLIVSRALFPIPIVEMDAASARQQLDEIFRRINWQPFSYGPFTRNWAVFREVVLNFLITIPAGLILPTLFRNQKRVFFVGLLVSAFGIELLQLSFEILVRVPYRVIDISDVILNSSGFVFGYLLYYLSRKAFHFFRRNSNET